MERVVTKFISIGSVAAAALAGILIAAVGAQAETRDHRGQPKLVAAPPKCAYYMPVPGCTSRAGTGWYCLSNPSKCRDHRN